MRGRSFGFGLPREFGARSGDRARAAPVSSGRLTSSFPQPASGPRVASSLTSPQHGNEATILVVEDDAGVRAITRRVLERLGHRVLEAESADAALGMLAITKEPIHLVITDIVMPGMSGRELAIRLSIERPAVRLLLMSGHDAVADEVQREEGLPFLQKPFSMEHLAASVGRALGTAA